MISLQMKQLSNNGEVLGNMMKNLVFWIYQQIDIILDLLLFYDPTNETNTYIST